MIRGDLKGEERHYSCKLRPHVTLPEETAELKKDWSRAQDSGIDRMPLCFHCLQRDLLAAFIPPGNANPILFSLIYDFILIKSVKKKERSFKLYKLMFNLFSFFFFFPKEFVSEIWEFGCFACCCLILSGAGSFICRDYSVCSRNW